MLETTLFTEDRKIFDVPIACNDTQAETLYMGTRLIPLDRELCLTHGSAEEELKRVTSLKSECGTISCKVGGLWSQAEDQFPGLSQPLQSFLNDKQTDWHLAGWVCTSYSGRAGPERGNLYPRPFPETIYRHMTGGHTEVTWSHTASLKVLPPTFGKLLGPTPQLFEVHLTEE